MAFLRRPVGIWLVIFSLFTLPGCDTEAGPGDVAKAFFTAIYIDRDLEAAVALSGPKLADLLNHYRNINEIQRNVIGMKVPNPEITVLDTSKALFAEYQDEMAVELRFDGHINGYQIDDVRTVIMKRLPHLRDNPDTNGWVVMEIKPDPFISNH